MGPIATDQVDMETPLLNGLHNGRSTSTNGFSSPGDKSMPIAVVGMSFRGPADATSVEKLWKMISEGREGWSAIPKEKWNNDAFYHPDNTRHGTINIEGGHFFAGDLARFDAPFFNLTNAEAAAMDPQQRLLLEGTFEALENAGLPLEKVTGSKTACFVGSFSGDYTDMLERDPDTIPMYQCTNAGQSRAITANRVSYFFDLKGPCVTVDTACSGSLVALHLACQTLRMGEAKMAVAAGVNTILSHEFMSTMSMMRFLSPDGRCYTFDDRANGYARGEGVGCLILKPLEDALRDKDTIRAVIRGSGSNQDGKTSGITLPSGIAQEELARSVYEAAGLDPLETEYVEAHGTGTQAGDPQETGALSRVFCPSRSPDTPLRIGSVKTNVGHLEGASGIAGVIKAITMLENRTLLPNRNFKTLNPRIPLDVWKLKVQLQVEPWNTPGPHRVSVNSFGYGGSNAHVILEDAQGYLSSHGLKGSFRKNKAMLSHTNGSAINGRSTDEPGLSSNGTSNHHSNGNGIFKSRKEHTRLFTLSTFDEASGKRQAERLASYLRHRSDIADDEFMNNLAFTLNNRRTTFMWKAAIPGTTAENLAQTLSEGVKFSRAIQKPTLGFVFTGQGAQWCGMGKELLEAYPVFAESIDRIGAYLKSIGSPFDVREEITRNPKESKINLALYSQPMCSAIQIALVDLLASWGIRPASVTGHSSGEIAAAYTMGALSMEDAMSVAYYRGVASTNMQGRSQVKGAMMAAGLSKEDVEPYLATLKTGKAVVACVNSPSSITISGDEAAVDELQDILDDKKLFARKLAVEVAYHSHHMERVADEYRNFLSEIKPNTKAAVGEPNSVEFFSSVTGTQATASDLGPEYWVKNMLGQVKFADSVRLLSLETTSPVSRAKNANKKGRRRTGATTKASVDCLVEIGPHSALAGPIKQILKGDQALNSAPITYVSALVRKRDAVHSILNLASSLLTSGWPVDLNTLNSPDQAEPQYEQHMLVDLPPYSWNHSKTYWAEPRISKVYRNRKYPRTDLLGVPDRHSSPLEPRWRNYIRTTEIPWVMDHKIQSNIVYPAAGYIVMAIEAAWQWASEQSPDKTIKGYTLREVSIGAALVISEQTASEVMLSLRPHRTSALGSSKLWREFSVMSVTEDNKWTEHSSGLIRVHFDSDSAQATDGQLSADLEQMYSSIANIEERCDITVNVNDFYEHLTKLGLEYGETFANMTKARSSKDTCLAEITISDTAATMPMSFEYPFVIHPSTLDSILHPIFVALSGGKDLIQDPAVPIAVDEIFVPQDLTTKPGKVLKVGAFTKKKDDSNLSATIYAVDAENTVLGEKVGLSIHGLILRKLPSQVSAGTDQESLRITHNIKWEPDVDMLTASDVAKLCSSPSVSGENLVQASLYDKCASLYISGALASIDPSEMVNKNDHLIKLWTLINTHAHANNTPDDVDRVSVIEKVKNSSFGGRLLCAIGEQLPAILREQIDPWTIVMGLSKSDTRLANIEQLTDEYGAAVQYIKMLGQKNPHLSILEVEAGAGRASFPILQALGGGPDSIPLLKQYTYSDLENSLFEVAKEKLSPWVDLLKFKELDVSRDIQEQGFEPHSYDIVLLGNSLLSDKSKHQVLKNLRTLLKDGGRFIHLGTINEQEKIAGSLIRGTLPNWWSGIEDWHQALLDTEFSGVDTCLRETHTSTLISRAIVKSVSSTSTDIVIITESEEESVDVNKLVDRFKGLSVNVKTTILAQAQPEGHLCVVLSDLNRGTTILAKPDHVTFETVKGIFLRSNGVLWVTRGGCGSITDPNASLVTGLARTARSETDGNRILTLDLDDKILLSREGTTEIIFSLVRDRLVRRAIAADQDVEYAERNGILHIPRVIESPEVNKDLVSILGRPVPIDQPLYQPGRKLRAAIGTPNQFETIHFIDDKVLEQLPDDYVAIDVKASGLNKEDIDLATGRNQNQDSFGAECSGVVTAVGKAVKNIAVYDRVSCFGYGTITNHYQDTWSAFQRIPSDMTFEQAAALPVTYCTAYHIVYNLARIEREERVLIHNIADAHGQSTLELCKVIGAQVFGTVTSVAEKEYIIANFGLLPDHVLFYTDESFPRKIMQITGNRGVNVVIDSLDDGEILSLSWKCIAPYGRFIKLGSQEIANNSRLEMKNFSKGTMFASCDILDLFKERRVIAEKVWTDVMCLFRTKVLQGPRSLLISPISEIGSAFSRLEAEESIGKVVVTTDTESIVKALPKDKTGELFQPGASYVLVGGLGGIGQAIASWMIDHGARSLIFLNRSGLAREESRETVQQLEAKGAKIAVYSCDVSNEAHVIDTVTKAKQDMSPIRGVIQAAMVLKDDLLERLSVEDYVAAVQPKYQGTWNLHNHLPNDMDFFLMLSSVTGVIGNATQSSYAVGNTFLDAFAAYRNSLGLPAVTLDLGVITEVGYLSENKELLAAMERQGFEGTNRQRLMALIQTAIAHPRQAQVITGLGTWREGQSLGNFDQALFAHFRRRSLNQSGMNGENDSADLIRDSLRASQSLDDASSVVCAALVDKIATRLGIPTDNVISSKALSEYGVDSLVAVEIRTWIAKTLGSTMPILELLASPSLLQLSRNIASRSTLVKVTEESQ